VNGPCNANFTFVKDAVNGKKFNFSAVLNDTNFKYIWTFGDNTGSDNRTPVKTYSQTGTYNVCLRVTKKDSSCTVQVCQNVTATASNTSTCNANWTAVKNATNNLKYQFEAALNDTSFKYKFTFGDGTQSDSRAPLKTYTTTGLKYVCLTVTKKDSSCTLTKCDSILVTAPDTACDGSFNIATNATNPLKKVFTALASPNSYNYYFWTFGDGTSAQGRVVEKTYTSGGLKTVCLTVRKIDSSCTKTICVQILLPNTSCSSAYTIQKDPNNSKKVYFSANLNDTNYKYFWSYGDGTSGDGRNSFRSYANHGKYKVCLTVMKKDSSCTSTTCDSISVMPSIVNCNANFTFDKDQTNPLKVYFFASLQDTNFRYSWTFGNGTSSDSKNPIKTFTTSGWYKVCLTVKKKDSTCTASKCDSIFLGQNIPVNCNANFNFDKDQSNPLKVYFHASLQDTNFRYSWTFGNGTSSDGKNPIKTFTASGWYKVCLTVKKKDSTCTASKCDSIYLAPNCTVNYSFSKNVNNGKQFTFETANDTTCNYIWFFGDGTSSVGRLATHTYINAGLYSVILYKIKKDSSCVGTHSKTVYVTDTLANSCFARFESRRFDSLGIAYGDFTNLSTGSFTHIKWDFGAFGTGLGSPYTKAFPISGVFPVCLTVYNISNGDTLCMNTTCKNFNTAPSTSTCHATYSYSNIGQNTFNFTNLSTGTPLLYTWKVNGTTIGTSSNLTYTFPGSGLYNVCLKIRKADSSCMDEICRPIMVNQYGTLATCDANFSYQSNPSNPGLIEFTNNSSSYDLSIWEFGDGSSSPDANPNHLYTSNGTYTVCLNMMEMTDSCSAMKCKDIVVDMATGIRSEEMSFTQVYPNPFEGTLFAEINSTINSEIEVNLFDLSGRKLWSGKDFVHKGNNLLEFNTNNIPEGICLLEIQSNHQRIVRKLIRK
jgi:PKD repeat protein